MTLDDFSLLYEGEDLLTVIQGGRFLCRDYGFDTDEWDGEEWFADAMMKRILAITSTDGRVIIHIEE